MVSYIYSEKKKAVNYAGEDRCFSIYEICNFLSFLEILINIWLIYLYTVKGNGLEIMFMLQGFLIFALHGLRNTQVRKHIRPILHQLHLIKCWCFNKYPSAKNHIPCCSSICRSESDLKERWTSFFHLP